MKERKVNYRKFYEKEVGRKIPKLYDIHHIDFNRNNNNIENLVAIPRKLHHQYHQCIFTTTDSTIENDNLIFKIDCNIKQLSIDRYGYSMPRFFDYHSQDYYIDKIMSLYHITKSINEYIDYRDYLLGKFKHCENIFKYTVFY